jgi:serine/threonine protein kinase
VLKNQPCNESSDVYSFGVILWELLTGEQPWEDRSAMQVVGAVGWNHERLAVPEAAHPTLRALLERCFGVAADRPAFSEIISILKRRLHAMGPPSSHGPPPASSGDSGTQE